MFLVNETGQLGSGAVVEDESGMGSAPGALDSGEDASEEEASGMDGSGVDGSSSGAGISSFA